MNKAKFAMAFHCYQPVFNFEREFECAYKNAYAPLLKTISDFPMIKASFHFSGNMLEWFERHHPEYIDEIKKLIRRDQIELIGGGCFEPVMTIIPEKDREGQLKMNQEIIERIFGIRAKGAWLAERVWAPELAKVLSASGIEYTIVDDHHFTQAGMLESEMHRPYITSSGDSKVTLFPALTFLRYSMPFKFPDVTIKYMKKIFEEKSKDGDVSFFFADDGEKFGLWPYTYNWVYRKGWLRNFFNLLEKNVSWLDVMTYSEVKNTVSSGEVEKVPESSYREMIEWSRGKFSNFLIKYSEAGRMHKRMLSVSDSIQKAVKHDNLERISMAKKELFKAQSGCAYWHGVFGGLYLPHLRSGVYRHLIKAQTIIDEILEDSGDLSAMRIVETIGKDDSLEIALNNRFINAFIEPDNGGSIGELDYKPVQVNLVNTMTRVKEKYHDKLEKTIYARFKKIQDFISARNFSTIHDLLGVGEKGLKPLLNYDDYERKSFLTHIFKDKKFLKTRTNTKKNYSNFLKGKYTASTGTVHEDFVVANLARRDKVFVDNGIVFDAEVQKEIVLGKGPAIMFSQKIIKHSPGEINLQYALEFNFMIWDKAVISKPRYFKTDKFSIRDRYEDVNIDFFLDKKSDVFMHPVFTVNETESGLKKTFQGISVLIGDDFNSKTGGNSREMKVTLVIG